jgi:hypothetical protein
MFTGIAIALRIAEGTRYSHGVLLQQRVDLCPGPGDQINPGHRSGDLRPNRMKGFLSG